MVTRVLGLACVLEGSTAVEMLLQIREQFG